METGESRSDGVHTDADDSDNVVRFPRDWFGPPEELIPFGPRAAEARPVDPDAFWGEESSAIHDVVVDRGEPPVTLTLPRVRIARRTLYAAGGAVLAIVCAGMALALFRPAAGRVPAVAADGGFHLFDPAAVAIQPLIRNAFVGAHVASRHGRAGLTLQRRRISARTSAATGTHPSAPVSVVNAQPSGGYVTPAVETPAAQHGPSTPPAASAPTAGSSAAASSVSATQAGPQGPGAPFAPGHMG